MARNRRRSQRLLATAHNSDGLVGLRREQQQAGGVIYVFAPSGTNHMPPRIAARGASEHLNADRPHNRIPLALSLTHTRTAQTATQASRLL